MIGHATFCIVVVYNNVIARLRRVSGLDVRGGRRPRRARLLHVPHDHGADAVDGLLSGALLAFALSFDEVIVTTFTAGAQNTLPLWIFGAIRLGQQLPEVNVVVVFVLLLTVIPVAVAARLAGSQSAARSLA